MDAVSRGLVVCVIEINHVVKFVGWNEQRGVVGAIGPDTAICVFTGLGQASDVIADPASSAVTGVDPASRMVLFEPLKQIAKFLIGSESIRIVGAGGGRDVIPPLKISPSIDVLIQ